MLHYDFINTKKGIFLLETESINISLAALIIIEVEKYSFALSLSNIDWKNS